MNIMERNFKEIAREYDLEVSKYQVMLQSCIDRAKEWLDTHDEDTEEWKLMNELCHHAVRSHKMYDTSKEQMYGLARITSGVVGSGSKKAEMPYLMSDPKEAKA